MKKNIVLFCFFAAILFLFSACDKLSLSTSKPASKAQVQAIKGRLLAQVNEWRVGLEDFEQSLKALEPIAQQSNLDVHSYDFKKRALNELVRNALLAEEAKSRGLDKDPDVLAALDSYKQNLLAQKVVAEAIKSLNVTDVEIENFYNQNPDYFRQPEQVKVREIVVSTKSEAQNLYIKLLQGDSFASLASIYSTADSAKQGGDLGYISYNPDERFKKFWEVVFTLDKQEMSSIFQGEDGKYYIVLVEDKKESTASPLQEYRDQIKNALLVDKQNRAVEELVNSAKQKAKVTINEDLLLK